MSTGESALLQDVDGAFARLGADPGGVVDNVGSLLAALQRGRLSHAVLLAGPVGCGKRWVAVRMAQCLRTLPSGLDTPVAEQPADAGVRAAWERIAAGGDPEVTLLAPGVGVRPGEAKTEIGIQQVRRLQERLTFSGTAGSRVAIVDPADKLSDVAQEGMLKTLEEPPPGVVLFLLTSRPSRLKPTVRSRCQLVRFTSPPRDALARLLVEDRGLSPEQARVAAELSGGDVRRALELDPDESADAWLALARRLYEVLGARGEPSARELAVEVVPRKSDDSGAGSGSDAATEFLSRLESILRDVLIAGELGGDELDRQLWHVGGRKASTALAERLPSTHAARALELVERARSDLALRCSPKVVLTSLLLEIRELRAS